METIEELWDPTDVHWKIVELLVNVLEERPGGNSESGVA